MNAYHAAVRSIEGEQEEETDEAGLDAEKGKQAKGRKKNQRGLLRIDSEATFSEVLEWSIANMLGLIQHFAGEMQEGPSAGSSSGRQRKKRKKSIGPSEMAAGLVDPTLYTRWSRVKVLAQIFWTETLYLLDHLLATQMIEYVLRSVTTPGALAWLWPFRNLRQRFFKRCCSIWAMSTSHSVRVLAFLFLRNSAAMALHAPDSQDSEVPQLESMIRMVLKSFADVAAMGYSWRSLNTFRFMENCLVELLRLDDAVAYRIGYLCIRQLALILRNACIATSQGGASAKKTDKKKAAQQQQAQSLVAWPFTRSVYLWTKAIGSLPALKPLAHPFTMITMGAVKHKLTSLQHFPFVYHCLRCLNRMGATLEVFIPISSHLLKSFSVLLQAMEKAHGNRGRDQQGSGASGLSGAKAPSLEVILRFSAGQMTESFSLEAIGSNICFLLTDHLGLLTRSPAFPEISALVLMHLRKYSSHCHSEPLRRQLKTLVTAAEASASDVRMRRESLQDVPNWKTFLLF